MLARTIISYALIIADLIFTRYWVHEYGLDSDTLETAEVSL